jgi:hypothetical protein
MSIQEALAVIKEGLDSCTCFEDSEGNYPCYDYDDDKVNKAQEALAELFKQFPK